MLALNPGKSVAKSNKIFVFVPRVLRPPFANVVNVLLKLTAGWRRWKALLLHDVAVSRNIGRAEADAGKKALKRRVACGGIWLPGLKPPRTSLMKFGRKGVIVEERHVSSFCVQAKAMYSELVPSDREAIYLHSNTTLESFLSSIGFSPADIAAYGTSWEQESFHLRPSGGQFQQHVHNVANWWSQYHAARKTKILLLLATLLPGLRASMRSAWVETWSATARSTISPRIAITYEDR